MLFFFIDVKLTVCQHQYQQQSASSVPGVFIPRCKPDGSYDDVQCRGSVCFCVDRRGHELRGTRVSIGEGSPKCAMPGVVKFFNIRLFSALTLHNYSPRPYFIESDFIAFRHRFSLRSAS